MTHIEQLIQDMCPYGVEFKRLGEVTNIIRGERVTKAQLIENGQYPVVSGGVNPMGYIDKYNREANTITIAQYGTAGYVNYITEKFWANDVCYSVFPNDELINRFLYYYLVYQQGYFYAVRNTDAVPYSIALEKIKALEIPIPPIEIQKKIVECLDKFSALAAELQAELQMRRKQYEYYCTHLLTPHSESNSADKTDDCNWEWKTLGEICDIKGRIGFRGYTRADQVEKGEGAISLSPANIKNSTIVYDDCTYITWAKYEESPEIMVDEGDIIFCKTASVGKTAYIQNLPEKATINPQLVLLKNIKCNNKYLSYYLQTDAVQNAVKQYQGVGSVPNVSQAKLSEIKIALPPLAEQARIVSILDKFESLTTSLSDGIPAEQVAQQKRYEYYRDKMLTFPMVEK